LHSFYEMMCHSLSSVSCVCTVVIFIGCSNSAWWWR